MGSGLSASYPQAARLALMGLVVGGSVDAMTKTSSEKVLIKAITTAKLTRRAQLPQLVPGDDTS